MRKTAFLSGLLLVASSLAFMTPSAQAAAPQAVDDTATVYTGRSVEIHPLANDSDVDNDDLTITSAAPAADHGSVVCTDLACTYTSTAGYVGADSFDYTISDGAEMATATVFITVNPDPVTTITLTSPDSGVIGTSQPISASAALASTGPAAGQQFELWGWPTAVPGSASRLDDAAADDSGAVTFHAAPTEAAMTLEVRWAVDDTVRSNTVTWTAVPAPNPVESIILDQPTTGTIGTSQAITGSASLHSGAAATGQQFQLWGAGANLATATADGTGTIVFHLAPTTASTSLQIRWAADDTVRSNTVTWTAVPAPNPVESIILDQPTTGTIGTSQAITGSASLHSGAAATGQQFQLWGAGANLATATADGTGTIVFHLAPTTASTSLQIRWAGDDTVRSNTATWTALVPITGISLKVSRPISTWPSPASFTGTITPKLADRTISLQAQATSGGWATVATGTTDSNGVATFTAAPLTFTFYRLSAGATVNSRPVAIFVTPALTAHAKKKGKYDVISGRVTPTRTGTPIKLQRKLPGKPWKTIKTSKATKAVVTGSLSRGYAFSFKIKGTKGAVIYRVWLPTDKNRDEAFSPKRTVRR